ncbi:MAG: outer membrane lipoprotein-sorting protein [Spirochaetia bacterium]
MKFFNKAKRNSSPRPPRPLEAALIAAAFIFVTAVPPLAAEPDFSRMLEEIDELGNFDDRDFSCVYTMVSEKPGEDVSLTQVRLFRRDSQDQFLLLILKPEAQRGQGYLQIDEVVWFYDPESRKFEKSTLKETIQDSDTQNSDLDRSALSEDYDVVDWSEGTLGSFEVYILDLEANTTEVSYDKLKLWVRKDVPLILKEEDYSVNARLMRTIFFPNYVTVAGRYLPSKALIIDELNPGERTQITMRDTTVADIPDYVFTKAYLERVNE